MIVTNLRESPTTHVFRLLFKLKAIKPRTQYELIELVNAIPFYEERQHWNQLMKAL